MKKRMHCGWFAAALAVLAGGVWATAAGAAAVEGSFARVKTLSELVPGDYVVTGSTKGNASGPFAMKNELGGSSTTYIQRHGDDPLPIEGLTDSLVDPDDSIVWTLAEAEGGWTLYNASAGVYAAYKGSGNSATFADSAVSNAVWTLSEGGTNGLFALENAAKPGRILQYNGTSGSERFACYTNYGTRAPGLTFWHKDGSGGGDQHAIAISPYIENGTLATDPSGTAAVGTWVVVTGIPSDPDNWHLAEVTVTHESSTLSYVYTTSGEPIAFEMPDEDVSLSARFEQGAAPGPGPGGGAIIFEGDDTGTVGGQVTFTATPSLFGAAVWLKTFEPPEGSALTEDTLGLDLPLVTFVPDVPGAYRFLFATGGGTVAEGTGQWTVTVAEAPGPGGDGPDIEGDDVGTVGEEVTFTVVPKQEGSPVYIQAFEPPEGSSLSMDTLGLDFPLVSFVPDVPGDYHFVFATDDGVTEWTVTVLPSEEELRITKIEVHGTTVRLEYIGDAASVQGTDDLEADTWTPLPSAVLDPANQTATLPAAGKQYLRLSTEPAPAHTGVRLWEGGPEWAETNVGADNPEDPGLYFWWGDTLGYKWENGAFVASDGSVKDYAFDGNHQPTYAYGEDLDKLLSDGWITVEGVLAPDHDAAQVQWGEGWRMPTEKELWNLNTNCTWTSTTLNGVEGCVVRGRGKFADASIFLPAVGTAYGTSLDGAGLYSSLWSSVPYSLYTFYSFALRFDTNPYRDGRQYERFQGYSVRPVRTPAE